MQPAPEPVDPEAAIMTFVRAFYGEAQKDPLLGPVFGSVVHNWETHYRTVADFWSRVLLGTDRYKGHPFPFHTKLPIELHHFERWLALFTIAAETHLPPDFAAKAVAKAHHMAESFKAGLFPFTDAQGKPSRLPV
jgi:hemoglobin